MENEMAHIVRLWPSPVTLENMDSMNCGSTLTEIMRDGRSFKLEEKCIPKNVPFLKLELK